MRWEDIMAEMHAVDDRKKSLANEWMKIQSACKHPRLPVRTLRENYFDRCPDCGFVSYCYEF